MRKNLSIFFAVFFAAVLFFNSCNEELLDPCGEIEAEFMVAFEECNTGDIIPAEDVNVFVSEYDNNGAIISSDTITTNQDGYFSLFGDGCSIDSIQINISYPGYESFVQRYNILCNDTIRVTLVCDTVTIDGPDSCSALDQTTILRFVDEETGKECIRAGNPSSGGRYNLSARLINSLISGETIRIIDLASVESWTSRTGKFAFVPPVGGSGSFSGNDYDMLTGQTAELSFEVITDEVGVYRDTLSFEVVCLDDNGDPYGSGTWTIILEAEVCEPVCDCPTEDDFMRNFSADERIEVGETGVFNFNLLNLTSSNFQPEGRLEIVDILRLDESGNEYALSSGGDWNHWNILTPVVGASYGIGDEIQIQAEFAPDSPTILRDTFRLRFLLYCEDELQADTCMINFTLQGTGCADGCPLIEIPYYAGVRTFVANTADALNSRSGRSPSDIWDESYMTGSTPPFIRDITVTDYYDLLRTPYNYDEVFFSFESPFAVPPTCDSLALVEIEDFVIRLRNSDIEYRCNEADYDFTITSINTGEPDSDVDADYFECPRTRLEVPENGESDALIVRFTPPSAEEMQTLIDNGEKDPADSLFKFRINITDGEGCHIVLNFKGKVNPVPEVSPVRHLRGYNEVSDRVAAADLKYLTCKIDQKAADGYWAPVKNNFVNNPTQPGPVNGDDSFYINVDDPTNNMSNDQAPELYLVNTTGNGFDMITSTPIARYAGETDFRVDLANLADDVLNGTGFTSRGNPPATPFTYDGFEWSPSINKSTFNPGEGIANLQAGDVFLIWKSSDGYYEYNSVTFPCHVAFIFIEEVKTGNANNTYHVSEIAFQVVYPVVKF